MEVNTTIYYNVYNPPDLLTRQLPQLVSSFQLVTAGHCRVIDIKDCNNTLINSSDKRLNCLKTC